MRFFSRWHWWQWWCGVAGVAFQKVLLSIKRYALLALHVEFSPNKSHVKLSSKTFSFAVLWSLLVCIKPWIWKDLLKLSRVNLTWNLEKEEEKVGFPWLGHLVTQVWSTPHPNAGWQFVAPTEADSASLLMPEEKRMVVCATSAHRLPRHVRVVAKACCSRRHRCGQVLWRPSEV